MKNQFIFCFLLATLVIQQGISQEAGQKAFNSVINAYLIAKNALASDDGDSARIAGKALYNAIENTSREVLPDDKKKIWVRYSEKLAFEAAHIMGTSRIDHQRKHFILLSDYMYLVVKAIQTNTIDLYYQYCPMANAGKGAYWLSETETIRNPYKEKAMTSCGSTKETFHRVR